MSGSPLNNTGRTARRRLFMLSLAVGVAALVSVAATLDDIGITTDEPNYYRSCLQQIAWVKLALQDFSAGRWGAPFSREILDRYWHFELIFNVHPPFYKLCSSLTLVLFKPWLGAMGAYRLSPAVMFSLLAGLIFWSVGLRYGIAAAFWAAAAFALMPRVFGHGHFGATDTPITLLWFASALSFHRALESKKFVPVFALVYGLALSTKFTALVIPLPLMAYVLLFRKFKEAARPVVLALVIGPLVMIGLNPEWWHHPLERVYTYLVNSYSRGQYLQIPTFYLGRQYDFYLPWHHSLVYTLFTVSPAVLAAFLYGSWRIARRPLADGWATHMLVHWLGVHFIMMLPNSPGHDGVRLFLPSFAFLAVVSAKGFHSLTSEVVPALAKKLQVPGKRVRLCVLVLILGMAAPAAVSLVRVHPYELCYYNVLAGGIPGAHKLGMETTYWYDVFNDPACKLINETIPDSAFVDTENHGYFNSLKKMGKIKKSLVFGEKKHNYILLYFRQGMFTDRDWLLYSKSTPLAGVEKDGVGLFGIYRARDAYQQVKDNIGRTPSPESYYDLAVVHRFFGDIDSSYLCLERYLEHEPANRKAQLLMVSLYLQRKQPYEAIKLLERISGNDGDKFWWHHEMGRAQAQLGRYTEAIASFRRALEYRSRDYYTLVNVAEVYLHTGQLDQALETLEILLPTNPESEYVLFLLGTVSYRLRDTRKAKDYYAAVLELNPEHVATLVNMGLISGAEGDPARAEEYYHRALALDSTEVTVSYDLAGLLAETGQTRLAEWHYKKILEEQPEDYKTHQALAMLYLQDPSRRAEALEHFLVLARLSPERAEFIRGKYIRPLRQELGLTGESRDKGPERPGHTGTRAQRTPLPHRQ